MRWGTFVKDLEVLLCPFLLGNCKCCPVECTKSLNQILAGLPRLAIILLTAIKQESVSNEWAVSRRTARVVKHVKSSPWRFSVFLPWSTSIGPK